MVLIARPARRLLPVRPSLLRKPHGVRQYSIQAVIEHGCKTDLDFLDLVPVAFMEAIHSTGLPWFAAIPVSAVLIRSLFVYPLLQKPLREKLVDRAQVQPLRDAQMAILTRSSKRDVNENRIASNKLYLAANSWDIGRQIQKSMFNRNPFAHRTMMFLTTIWVSDSLRKLMGAKEGLLKFILGPLDWTLSWLPSLPGTYSEGEETVETVSANTAPAQTPTQASLDRFQFPTGNQEIKFPTDTKDFWSSAEKAQGAAAETAQNTASQIAQESSTSAVTVASDAAQETSTAIADHANSIWFDPTLMTEGFSWCPDLTASDPTMILPIIFSSSFFASIYFAPRLQGAATTSYDDMAERPKATNGQRIGMTVAMLSIIPALQMPAGLLLYFISNMVTNNFLSRWLAYTKPIHPAPTACKRPVRMQRFKDIAEDGLPSAKQPIVRR